MLTFTIFTETKMHLVQPPKFYISLGITAVKTEIEDNGYANMGGDEVHYGLSENSELCFL